MVLPFRRQSPRDAPDCRASHTACHPDRQQGERTIHLAAESFSVRPKIREGTRALPGGTEVEGKGTVWNEL